MIMIIIDEISVYMIVQWLSIIVGFVLLYRSYTQFRNQWRTHKLIKNSIMINSSIVLIKIGHTIVLKKSIMITNN